MMFFCINKVRAVPALEYTGNRQEVEFFLKDRHAEIYNTEGSVLMIHSFDGLGFRSTYTLNEGDYLVYDENIAVYTPTEFTEIYDAIT